MLINSNKQKDKQFANLMHPSHNIPISLTVVLAGTVSQPQEVMQYHHAVSPQHQAMELVK